VHRYIIIGFLFLTKRMFKQITHLSHNTFKFLCERLGPHLHMKTTRMREAISIENRVVMLLRRLGTKNGLFIVGEVYGVAKSTISKIVRTFCRLVRFHLQPVLVQFSSPT
jgi:hypothetical protein